MAIRRLLEDTWQFKPDFSKIVESKNESGKLRSLRIPGVLSQYGVVNGNKRRYGRNVWEANLKEDSRLMDLIRRKAAFGQLEHPANGIVDLSSDISHVVSNVELKEDGNLCGEITILVGDGFPSGNKLKGLIEFGYNPLVSSRGFGSTVTGLDGIDEVQEDFVCEGWDVVSVPSFCKAELSPQRESTSVTDTQPGVPAVVESTGNPAGAGTPQPKVNQVMDMNAISASIAALKNINIFAESQRSVTESFTKVANLHKAISEHRAANPSSDWDCQSAHNELNEIAAGWISSIKDLKQTNEALSTDNKKLVVLAENLAKVATSYRTQLTDVVKKRAATVSMYEKATERGRGWKAIATNRGKMAESLEFQCNVACEAVDQLADMVVAAKKNSGNSESSTIVNEALVQLAEKYHADTTRLAKKILVLNHPEIVKNEELNKKLNEAKTYKEILGLRSQIEKPNAQAAKPEAKQESTAPEKQEINEAVREDVLGHSPTVDQVIGIVERLSSARLTKK